MVQITSTPVISRITRSRKKRKAKSPASPADCSEIKQVDGPAPSPLSSPEERRPPSAPSSPGCEKDANSSALGALGVATSSPVVQVPLKPRAHGHLWKVPGWLPWPRLPNVPHLFSTRLMFPSALSARKQFGRMPLKLAMQARPSAERQGWELLNVLVNSRSCFVFVLY